MIETGNRLKWSTGAFALFALMVMAYSGAKLSQLYDTPLIGVSSESKLAKRKWNQLETIITEKAKKDWGKLTGLLIRTLPDIKGHKEKSISSQEIQQVVRYKKQIPPEISGIIIRSDSITKFDASVIIGGKCYSENDEVSGYVIKDINESGVSFSKNGRHFFVDAPKAFYSINQGN